MHPIRMFFPCADFACYLMQVLTLPAKRGFQWLVEGMAIFRMRPTLLIFLVLAYWLTMVVISMIPYLGQAIGFLLIPAFSVSLMNACRIIDKKEVPPPQLLFSGFHRNIQTLLILGVVYIVSTLIALGCAAFFDGGQLFRMMVFGEVPNTEASAATSRLATVFLIPVVVAFWFAPVLAAWHDMSAGKSLFFSLIACMRNWRVFLVYALTISTICVFILLIGSVLLAMGSSALSGVFPVMFSLILLPTIYASFYVSYRDVFAKQRDEA